jgi:hypothetical protein
VIDIGPSAQGYRTVKSAAKIRTVRRSVSSEIAAYWFPQGQQGGETMTIQIMAGARQPNSKWAEWKQDLLLVSSFGFWAVLIGLAPVVTLLMAG